MATRWQRIARAQAGPDYAATYAARFREAAERGEDIHGEAHFVSGLVPPPARVLDAGCGTGRIAQHLAGRGYDVVGVDVDEAMLEVARAEAPQLDWRVADLAGLDLTDPASAAREEFDVVLLAGNIVPLLEPGTLSRVAERLADHTAAGGHLVCGFGLDEAHLPAGCPVTPLAAYDAAVAAAGLVEVARFSGWSREPFPADPAAAGYVVSVHARGDHG